MMQDLYKAAYTLKINVDTFLKQSTLQSTALSQGEKVAVKAGTEFPIGSWANAANKHVRVTFGLDKDGKQISFAGPDGEPRNTWILFKEHCDILKEGRSVSVPMLPPRPKTDIFALHLKPTGERDAWDCVTFVLAWTKNGEPVDQMVVLSGAPGAEIVEPGDDFAGSLRPIPEGIYNLGPVERGWFGDAMGYIAVEMVVQPSYAANDRSALFIHEDANRSLGSPGSAGCICPYDALDMERVASWLSSSNRPNFIVVDHGLGFLKAHGFQGPYLKE